MEIDEALRMVRALANGTNPADGSACADPILKVPKVVIALNRAAGALEVLAEREQAKLSGPANSFRYWSKGEDAQVCEELRDGLDFPQIAKKHNRSVPSIVARLIKLGKIAPKVAPRRESEPLFPEEPAILKKAAS
jgi:hypothetical protein